MKQISFSTEKALISDKEVFFKEIENNSYENLIDGENIDFDNKLLPDVNLSQDYSEEKISKCIPIQEEENQFELNSIVRKTININNERNFTRDFMKSNPYLEIESIPDSLYFYKKPNSRGQFNFNNNIQEKNACSFQRLPSLLMNKEQKKKFEVKKFGRKKKDSIEKRSHDKNANDNIKRKVKRHFINSLYFFLLSKFNRNKDRRKGKLMSVLKKIDPQEKTDVGRNINKIWLNKTLEEIFSVDISTKFGNYSRDYNIRIIKQLLRKKTEKDVINLLGKKVKELLKIYLFDNEDEEYERFEHLKDMLKRLEKKGESKIYIESVKNVAQSLLNG